MVEMFETMRLDLIKHLQLSLRTIRQVMGLSAQELGNLIGLTRQTINNLENVKTQMTATQYVSLSAVIDDFTAKKPELLPAILAVLEASVVNTSRNEFYSTYQGSFLKGWFQSFAEEQQQRSLTLSEIAPPELLKELAHSYKIFLDSSSLLCEGAVHFLDQLVPHLLQHKVAIIVPLRVIETIQQLSAEDDAEQGSKAQQAITLLGKLQKQGVLQIRGEKNDSNVHSTIISVFAKYKATYRLFLITQDEELAGDVLAMNEKEYMSGFTIGAGFIADDGKLHLYNEEARIEHDSAAEKEDTVEEHTESDDILTSNIIKGWDNIE